MSSVAMQQIDVGIGMADIPIERLSYSEPGQPQGDGIAEIRQEVFRRVSRGVEVAEQSKRHWEAADRDGRTSAQWCQADGRHINAILVDRLETVRDRSLYEHRVNATVEGVIETHKSDVIGRDGPQIEFETDDNRWNEETEMVLRDVFLSDASADGCQSMGDLLKQGIESLWTQGDMLGQIIYDRDAESPVKTRINPIDAPRLRSPFGSVGDPRILLGVERNRLGRPLKYHIAEEDWSQLGYGFGVSDQWAKTKPIPARDMIHEFRRSQPGQVRGFPWLASCLQTLEDLRGYDHAVLEAAKVAAMMAVLAHATSDTVDPVNFEKRPDGSHPLRAGQVNYMQPGWQATSLNPSQPANNHVEYRSERHRELGRGVGMPLMQIRLDSSGHNYSSARFDGQIYARSNEVIQSWLERKILDRMIKITLAEAMLVGAVRPRPLRLVRWVWNWDQRPHVDPVKEAMAERIRLENRTISPQRACRSHGADFETIAREWGRANEVLERNGMPPMLGPVPTSHQELAKWLQMDQVVSQQPNEN